MNIFSIVVILITICSSICTLLLPVYTYGRRVELTSITNEAYDYLLELPNLKDDVKCVIAQIDHEGKNECNTVDNLSIRSCEMVLTENGRSFRFFHSTLFQLSTIIYPEKTKPHLSYPNFILCSDNPNAEASLMRSFLGHVTLYTDPSRDELGWTMTRTKVHVFINPGWTFKYAIHTPNLSFKSIISLKSISALCNGIPSENAFRVIPTFHSITQVPATANILHFQTSANYRNIEQREELQKWRTKFRQGALFHICYYSDSRAKRGLPIGQLQFAMDHFDAAALVGFIIFSILAMPLICGGILSCTLLRLRFLRIRSKKFFLLQQQQEAEIELSHLGEVQGVSL